MEKFILDADNYYSQMANRIYCSSSQYKDAIGCPAYHGCEARMMATLNGEWEKESTNALLIGTILDTLWELSDVSPEERTTLLAERFPDCISTRGATKGELKAEFKKCIQLYERTYRDEKFRAYMSGDHQTIFTGEIEGLPFKVKLDSFVEGKAIVDLKTTEDASREFRKYVPDSGERLPFYSLWGYDTQLAIYREIVRQNTGDTLECYIAAVDKKPHPLPAIINLERELLDKALDDVKMNCEKIIRLKSGEIEPIRCNSGDCDYCRDTYVCEVVSSSEFETFDTGGGV